VGHDSFGVGIVHSTEKSTLDCSEYRAQIIPFIKGHLGPEESERLRRHMESCELCRNEHEESEWLVKGMVSTRDKIKDGHISSHLLHQYIRSPGALEPETIDFVQEHFDRCDQCRQDAVGIEKLSDINIGDNNRGTDTGRGARDSRRSWFRPRLVPAYAMLAVVLITAVVVVQKMNDATSLLIAKAVSHADAQSAGLTVVALTNEATTRGDDTKGEPAPQVISKKASQPAILSLEAVTFEYEDLSYSVQITSADGSTLWQSELTVEQLEAGKLWLILDQAAFDPGVYQITVIEHEDDYQATISTARIDIVE
jgi:hypothetical protein